MKCKKKYSQVKIIKNNINKNLLIVVLRPDHSRTEGVNLIILSPGKNIVY